AHAQDGLPLSPGTSLEGDKNGGDDVDVNVDVDSVAEKVRVQVDSARIARETQRAVQRQVDAEMRKAQREIEQAQRDVARETGRVGVNVSRIKTSNESSDRFQAKETRPFAVSGSPRIPLTPFDGHVTIHGWEKPEVTYTAVKGSHDEES